MTDSGTPAINAVKSLADTTSVTVGLGPSVAVIQTQLALAQSQSVLFANLVSSFSQQNISANAAMSEGITRLLQDPEPSRSHNNNDQCSVDTLRQISQLFENNKDINPF